MPMFSMLMKIFLWDKGSGDSLSDYYLDQDCTTFCYQGIHRTTAVIATITIAIFCRVRFTADPYGNEHSFLFHIKTKSSYLSALSIFQVIIAILNKTLKPASQVAHSFELSVLILLMIIYTVKANLYNIVQSTILQVLF
jgi:hypothetical protein